MNKLSLLIGLVLLVNFVSATQVCQVYDDFSSGVLNTSKWGVRQDYEGQPLISDSGLDINLQNFHTEQDTILGDHRTYLVPMHKFKSGEILEFDIDFISAGGNSMTMLLIDNQSRIGLGGCWDGICQAFDKYHIILKFNEGFIEISKNNIPYENITINSNEQHEIYIGTVFGHNGVGHIDYDNFKLCTEVPQSTLEDRVIALEKKVTELENKVTLLEILVNKIKSWFWFIPYSTKKDILCSSLRETGEKKITEWNITCEMKKQKKYDVCVCKKA